MAEDDTSGDVTSVGLAIAGTCDSIPDAVRFGIYYEPISVLYLALSAVASLVRFPHTRPPRATDISAPPTTPPTTDAFQVFLHRFSARFYACLAKFVSSASQAVFRRCNPTCHCLAGGYITRTLALKAVHHIPSIALGLIQRTVMGAIAEVTAFSGCNSVLVHSPPRRISHTHV